MSYRAMETLLRTILPLLCVLLASVAKGHACSAPPEYPGFRMVRSSKQTAWYKCSLGYNPFGGSPMIRCSRGEWTKLTLQCEKNSCGSAGDLNNGHFKYEGEAVLGDKAYAICDDGYEVKGSAVIECGSDGWPFELPTCEEAVTTCSAPNVTNTGSTILTYEFRVGDSVRVRCSQGFQMKGEGQLTCGSDGQWHPPPPECVPTAAPAPTSYKNDGCGVPKNIQVTNAALAPKYTTQTSFVPGSRVYYVCDVGYVSQGIRYHICINGQWSPLQLQCQKKQCGSAGEILNGRYEYTGTEFGDTATAVCNEGYQLVGHATRPCLSQGWDGHPPVCDE